MKKLVSNCCRGEMCSHEDVYVCMKCCMICEPVPAKQRKPRPKLRPVTNHEYGR